MQSAFEAYTAFGARQDAAARVIDNNRFAKICRDSHWLDDGKLDKAAVDLIWTKVMRKARKMDWRQFQEAVQLVAEKKGLAPDQLPPMTPPQPTNATQFADDAWVKRQTDHTLYTGAHKLKFDADTGKGLGKSGREDTQVKDLSDVTNRGQFDIRGRNIDILEKQREEQRNREPS